ncbi:glycosyltransferase [Knoellia sp. S7-12]|uniref:glycosyltransferase n=1 Tax=Knoellia sp. S7-12 TaxID=3126698 RepID=UPI00336621E9
MDVSVIVCAHNEEQHLPSQLNALIEQECPGQWELIVVDNASTDKTALIAKRMAQRHPKLRVIQAEERKGKGYALAVGVRSADSDLIVFCDADDVVAPGWLAALVGGLASHDVVTGPHELDLLNPPWLADSRGRSIEEPLGSFFGIFPCIRGASWATHRRVWDAVGGVREDFSAGEDAEFSLRCWQSGVEIVGVPDAVVHYRYRDSPRALWRQGLAYGRSRPRIARILIDAGLTRPARFAGARSWMLLAISAPTLLTRRGRAQWMWIAGNRAGQLMGSVSERTFML